MRPGSSAIQIELDDAGNKKLGELTKSHLNQPLAVLINNKVDIGDQDQERGDHSGADHRRIYGPLCRRDRDLFQHAP